jgi:Bacterial protein of unknown function (DUF937)
MNLVDLVKDQLTSEITNKLGSLIGGSDAQTKSAVAAAVPALLAALSGTAAKGGSGANTLLSVLSRFESGSLQSAAGTLTNDPGKALEQGTNLLDPLLGEGTLSGLAGAVSRFAKLDSNTARMVISSLAPLVMGAIARQFRGQPITGPALTSLFSEQKANIANALPTGLSLAGIPGLPQVGDTVRDVAGAARQTVQTAQRGTSPFLKALIPLALLALVAFLGWQYYLRSEEGRAPKPVAQSEIQHEVRKPVSTIADSVPDAAQFSKNLTSVYSSATEALAKVKDTESAKAALPQLEELQTKVDGLKATWDKVPAPARSSIAAIMDTNLGKLKKLIEPLLANPTIKEVLQPILDQIVAKLEAFKS